MTGTPIPNESFPELTRLEQVLLKGLPAEKQTELLPLLRSPDQMVREMALVLIVLDLEEIRANKAQPPPGSRLSKQ